MLILYGEGRFSHTRITCDRWFRPLFPILKVVTWKCWSPRPLYQKRSQSYWSPLQEIEMSKSCLSAVLWSSLCCVKVLIVHSSVQSWFQEIKMHEAYYQPSYSGRTPTPPYTTPPQDAGTIVLPRLFFTDQMLVVIVTRRQQYKRWLSGCRGFTALWLDLAWAVIQLSLKMSKYVLWQKFLTLWEGS